MSGRSRFSQLFAQPPVGDGEEPKRRGRPAGKRSNPEYEQVTAYIRKTTYRQVKLRLLATDGGEFSELVQRLLERWLLESAEE